MPFLSINNQTVPVRDRTPSRKPSFKGRRERSRAGQMRDGRRDKKRRLSLTSVVSDIAAADALRHLIQGEGHYFSFDNGLDASTGLQPSLNATVKLVTSGGKFNGFAEVESAGSMAIDAQLPEEWTVSAWIDDGTGAGFEAIALRSDNTQFESGVSGSFGVQNVLSESSGILTILGVDRAGANAAVKIDELVVLPWFAVDAQIAAWHGLATSFSPLPFLNITGDMIEETNGIRVRGNITSQSYIQRGTSSDFRNSDIITEFELIERETV